MYSTSDNCSMIIYLQFNSTDRISHIGCEVVDKSSLIFGRSEKYCNQCVYLTANMSQEQCVMTL